MQPPVNSNNRLHVFLSLVAITTARKRKNIQSKKFETMTITFLFPECSAVVRMRLKHFYFCSTSTTKYAKEQEKLHGKLNYEAPKKCDQGGT